MYGLNTNVLDQFAVANPVLFVLLLAFFLVWSVFWKGWALWRAVTNKEKYWFIALLVINTFGILEILYIFVFSKKQTVSGEKMVAAPTPDGLVSFDKFRETDLRVAKVKSAERVSGSDKLIKIQLDDGSGSRQIVAGIGKVYEPEMLLGKEIVIVANLVPRKLMGLESQGMLLAATEEGGNPVLVVPEKEVQPGVRLS